MTRNSESTELKVREAHENLQLYRKFGIYGKYRNFFGIFGKNGSYFPKVSENKEIYGKEWMD